MDKTTIRNKYVKLIGEIRGCKKHKSLTTFLWYSLLFICFNTYAQTNIDYSDFESGTQGWTLGSNAGLNTSSSWSCGGNNSIFVNDDKGSSVATSAQLDISSYSSVTISFCFIGSTKIDNGEGFDLEYFDGSSWILLKSYRRGTDFTDIGNTENYNYTFPLLSWDYNFASNARFRFLGKSSKGDEICYFDNILIKEAIYFFDGDSDNDGINDSIDIDDDNDGILDTIECSTIVNPPLLNANFEDLDILTLDGGPTDVVPTAGIWKGDASNIPSWDSADLTNNYLEIWHNSQAAGNDAGGQAFSGTHWAEVNATTNDGLYQDVVSTPGDILQWTFAHRKRTGFAGSSNEDIVQLLIGDTSGNLISQGAFVSAGDSSWTNYSGTYIVPAGQTTTRLTFTVLSTASGSTSTGNFIDNVQLFVIPTNCEDTDGDSIPDYFDLDSDNDGIPDIVETGLGSISAGTGTIPLTSFIDIDNNGMHDSFESNVPLDTDGDGTPNYLDLDSDNDTVFDVDEARTERTVFGVLVQENGDGDISGDGVGDGVESEAFRERDANNDGILEYFGDGILDIYDYGTGSNEYGNLNQGSAPYYVKNADGLDTPDYIDLDSNNDGIFDIAETLYANLDANNDGVIDDTNDADGDGLLDLFDTNDTQRGSPRDLNQKLELFFDGRNDYVEDTNLMSGWSEATLMAWIKPSEVTGTISQIIMGQNNFHLLVNPQDKIMARTDLETITGPFLTPNQWVHVAATYSNSNSIMKLYINGQEILTKAVSGSLAADTSKLTLGRHASTNDLYFKGYLDEARVFFKALSQNEIQKMVYQEIEDNNGVVRGAIIPTDVTDFVDATTNTPLTWTNLKRYYRMDAFKDNVLDDLTTPEIDEGSGARIYNTKVIVEQSAPLPFVTQQSGSLDVAVNDAVRGINGSDAVNYDYSIIKVQHDDVTFDATQKHVGLIIDELDAGSNPIKFRVTNDSELNVSWYLKLDGLIDLEGESQLIQGLESELDVTSAGKIERDQQGTADTYTYNYWSTPVGVSNITTNNNNYTLPDVMRDGTQNITFLTSGYDGTSSSPIGIADYWIWKFANQLDDDYSSWQHVRSTGTILPGEGFTMKGPGTGPISSEQNYVFLGKPNNGDINLTMTAGNDYLIGNPYASAIDAHQFILDNGPLISGSGATTGTLFFWEHWGGGSHYLADYLGGYATYNLSGGIPAASMGTNDPDVGTGGTPTKTPGRYIPVSQGFFVVAETSGTINFNNGQRVFQKESASSVFMEANPIGNEIVIDGRSSEQQNEDASADPRPQLRIGFNSVNTIRRQLLLTVDDNATDSIDWGYDGILYETQMDDLVWMIDDEKFTIQGIGNLDDQTVLPLGIRTNTEGMNSITLDAKVNTPQGLEIYVHDKELDIYHDLENGDYEFYMMGGQNLERFEIVFSPEALGVDDINFNKLDIHFSNELESIVLINPLMKNIKSIEMLNVLGQTIYSVKTANNSDYAEYKVSNLSTGTYVLQLDTESGIISKKVLVE